LSRNSQVSHISDTTAVGFISSTIVRSIGRTNPELVNTSASPIHSGGRPTATSTTSPTPHCSAASRVPARTDSAVAYRESRVTAYTRRAPARAARIGAAMYVPDAASV
jgi:hypothetical protein